MVQIGYHASHEQFAPSALLRLVQLAEQAGFERAMCSDHFYPWSEQQGQSGHAWTWLGAALQATGLPFGVVNAPGYRYHPAVLAQAIATLGELFPGRFWVALGSGEALNERITGEHWPRKADRNARLRECADVMRALWAGETVSHYGHIVVEEAKLYTRPTQPIRVVGAAITEETAEWMGGWADALITINQPDGKHRKVAEAFRRGGGEGKPLLLQVKVSWAPTDAEALRQAHEQWRTNVFDSPLAATLRTPAQFEAAAAFVQPEDMRRHIRIATDVRRYIDGLAEDAAMGFTEIYVHNVGLNQEAFIEQFAGHVLPAFAEG